ncbi:iron-containing alcohol dehydrogenase [Vibrio mangrovi]|uniref:Alcohol dehydrogenase YqhD n=1 Tax=Vibrio mangrovi TaxID=474394 RepID=A0A1Y6J103_9VIBR|nr:iron-containing alcohol dehydrogenase [Vibrio mangrovi]MDW6002913.1 iron-containing alcohol dehydrogenase [Vibrio mangrovi]SMS02402.1 Alcohol dehydrogenase YqhD [Vibrio mangrovi]
MDNFTFYNPTRIHFGRGEIAKITQEIGPEMKVMITYGGGSIKKNGVLEQVKQALKGITFIEFGGIEPNPHYETLLRAIDIVREEKIDFLLAVGGGSVIDGTKFIAAGAKYPGHCWDIIESGGDVVKEALPIGCVLTIAATGSEMNNGASLTRAETNDKVLFISPEVLPRFSILDPETTFSLPANQTGNGVIDAFVHVLEQYITYPVHAKVQDRLAEGLLNTLKEEGPKVLKNPTDYDARANIMWAATMALNGLLKTGIPNDWATHMIGMELTGLYGLDHAQTLTILMPALWKYKKAEKLEKLAQYAANVWGIEEGSDESKADQAIEATIHFFESMGLKTRLSDYDLGSQAITEVVAKLKEHGLTALGEHANIHLDDVEKFMELAL